MHPLHPHSSQPKEKEKENRREKRSEIGSLHDLKICWDK